MILKDKTPVSSVSSIKQEAGILQERDVAFYLRRAYKDRDNVMVLNDIRIEHDGETAQIDHLIVYSYGFIVVESKSIRGEININEYGECSRSYKGQWSGMPSPLKQAELQLKLLKQYLCDHTERVIGKFLGIQQGLGARCYDVFCAISSDAIIDRSKAPKELADKLVKSEFITDALDKKMNFKKFYDVVGKIADTRPTFCKEEMLHIGQFLLADREEIASDSDNETVLLWPAPAGVGVTTESQQPTSADLASQTEVSGVHEAAQWQIQALVEPAFTAQCKYCGECSALYAQSGRYGYYVQCNKCGGNTPLKRPCPICKSQDTKVTKSRSVYKLVCQTCSAASHILIVS